MIVLPYPCPKFQDKLSASQPADVLRALRMSAHKETKDLTCRSEHVDYYVILIDHPAKLSEAVLGLRSAQDAHVPMGFEG